MSAKQDLWQTSTCTSGQRSPNRKNSRIGKSAISRKQPLLFSSEPLVGKGSLAVRKQQPKLSRSSLDKNERAIIKVRPSRDHRWQKHDGWEVFEAEGVCSIYCDQHARDSALSYARHRAGYGPCGNPGARRSVERCRNDRQRRFTPAGLRLGPVCGPPFAESSLIGWLKQRSLAERRLRRSNQ